VCPIRRFGKDKNVLILPGFEPGSFILSFSRYTDSAIAPLPSLTVDVSLETKWNDTMACLANNDTTEKSKNNYN
jgi:hypothetical protein